MTAESTFDLSELNRVRIDGVPVDVVTESEAISHILNELKHGRGGVVATPNIDHLRLFEKSQEVRDGYESADLSLADGMPLVWASRLRGTPLPERVAGSDLTVSLAAAANRDGRSIYLLGGNPGVAEDAGRKLQAANPGLKIAGAHCPPYEFEQDEEEMALTKSLLSQAGPPDIVWFLGIGISLSFISGEVTRAPDWMANNGLEWLHRIWKEPRRLGRRYLIHGLPYGLRMLNRAFWTRFLRSN